MLKPFLDKKLSEAGCDEAGRGCLAGPVFAAAVILPKNFKHKWLNDSKQLSEKQRIELKPVIEGEAISFGVSSVNVDEIDDINILNASFLAMHRAIDQLKCRPEQLLIDGNRFKQYHNIPHKCIIEGDAKFMSIAAASVLAKVARDEYMQKLHLEFPKYGWNKNKGYATRAHRFAIEQFGACDHHRKSFTLLPAQFRLHFD